jgi:hypothetical protein
LTAESATRESKDAIGFSRLRLWRASLIEQHDDLPIGSWLPRPTLTFLPA